MMRHLRTTAIACSLVATLACQQFGNTSPQEGDSADPGQSDVAATVNGQPITVGEIDHHIKEQLFDDATSDREPTKLYEVRSRALNGMIEQELVEKAASDANLSTEDFLRQQVDALGEVPEEEIVAVYNEFSDQMGGLSVDEMRGQIIDYIKQKRVGTVVADLRKESNTEILLEPFRIEVEAIGPSKGPDDAVVTIIEFSDFQCPFCQRVVPTIDQIVAKYPTEVRFVFRNLPLSNIHPRAQAAAEAAACANNQGRFWDYHDLIFANNRALTDEDLERYASEVGLELEAFRQCVQNRETRQIVDADTAVAEELQISGTPSFLINGIPLHGAQSLEAFSQVIDEEIARSASDASEAAR